MTPTASLSSPVATTTTTTPPTVAVIGCGPGGMFFCHALESRRQSLLHSDPSSPLLSTLPLVTCFERGASPGGVWRAKRQNYENDPTDDDVAAHRKDSSSVDALTNMYEALWTNGPKEGIEFFDYTFDDHFERQLPVYIPRQAVLKYITSRVTKNCPNFFEQYVQFHTSVESVTFSNAKFHITTRHVRTGEVNIHEFDKCIWAAGDNGKPKMPTDLVKMLHDGGFLGRIMHSSDAHRLKEDVQGKRVLMIGGGYSAEDLALMAIKLGVAKVMISSRSDDPVVAWTGAWPMDKVKVYSQRVPVSVEDNGRSIRLAGVDYTWPNQYTTRRKKSETLRDIDTVIFCTGYEQNMEMMEESLKKPFKSGYDDRFTAFPPLWKMAKNVLSQVTGRVKPGDVRYRLGCVMPGLYRGVLIDNPSMMYLLSEFSEFPLLAADVNAWMLLGFITGTTKLPSPDEMTQRNDQQALTELNMPYLRYWMDRNYRNRLDNVDDFWAKDDEDDDDPRWYEGHAQYDLYEIQRLAEFMEEANYPLRLGTKDALNEKGEALHKFNDASYHQRANLVEDKEQGWRTFRDCDNADQFYSIHTGTKAVPLKSHWLDLDDHDPNLV